MVRSAEDAVLSGAEVVGIGVVVLATGVSIPLLVVAGGDTSFSGEGLGGGFGTARGAVDGGGSLVCAGTGGFSSLATWLPMAAAWDILGARARKRRRGQMSRMIAEVSDYRSSENGGRRAEIMH